MTPELEQKLRKYFFNLTSSEILKMMRKEDFPFFGMWEKDCIDLAWEIIAERKLRD